MKRHQTEDNNTAAWYDTFHFSERAKRESNPCRDSAWLLNLLARSAPVILDIGCARGQYFQFIPPTSQLHAIDISPKAIEDIRTRFPSVTAVAHDVTTGLPYNDNFFDLVYCGELLEHLEDPARLVDEMYRVLRPGGICVMNTPFEDLIPCDVHLWFIERSDLDSLFSKFRTSVFRFDNSPNHDQWEHFLVVAMKPNP